MEDKQREKIWKKTGHSFDKILEMTPMEFFSNITKCFLSGAITRSQHNFLDNSRKKHQQDPQVQGVFEVFDKAEFV